MWKRQKAMEPQNYRFSSRRNKTNWKWSNNQIHNQRKHLRLEAVPGSAASPAQAGSAQKWVHVCFGICF